MSEMQELEEGTVKMQKYPLVMDEAIILSHPWALRLMNTIKQMSKRSVLDWCSRVILLGEDSKNVDNWIEIFANHVENTFEELISDVRNLQNKTQSNIQELHRRLKQLSNDLHVPTPVIHENENLYQEQHYLMKIIEEYEMKVNVKRKELQKLRDRQIELCKILETEPLILTESPLPTPEQLNNLERYIERLEKEKNIREKKYMGLKNEIVQMMNVLRIDATLDFEEELLSTAPDCFIITDANMKELENYHETLSKTLKSLKEEISHFTVKINDLWLLLDVDTSICEYFRQQYCNPSLETLEALKCEYKRLQELKTANIKVFIEKRREELLVLWGKCHHDNSQNNEFHFLYSDIYSEDLLEIHDREIEKWNKFYEENKELIKLVEKHKLLWYQFLELEQSAESVNRYKNRGGQLLLEEKARNKLSKQIPDLEQRMMSSAMNFRVAHGYPFTTFGKTIEEHIQILHDRREEEKKLKLSLKKNQRDNRTTPAKSSSAVLFSGSNPLMRDTPVSTKTKTTQIINRNNILKESNHDEISIKSPSMPTIKVAIVGTARRLSAERRRKIEKCRNNSRRMPLRVNQDISEDNKENDDDDTNPIEHDTF